MGLYAGHNNASSLAFNDSIILLFEILYLENTIVVCIIMPVRANKVNDSKNSGGQSVPVSVVCHSTTVIQMKLRREKELAKTVYILHAF